MWVDLFQTLIFVTLMGAFELLQHRRSTNDVRLMGGRLDEAFDKLGEIKSEILGKLYELTERVAALEALIGYDKEDTLADRLGRLQGLVEGANLPAMQEAQTQQLKDHMSLTADVALLQHRLDKYEEEEEPDDDEEDSK